jgi:GDP-L-fucose synthase
LNKNKPKNRERIFIAGHKGLVGSAIYRLLSQSTNHELITINHKELDLTNQNLVKDFFSQNHISQVYISAAKVGGIYANENYPADFIYQNLLIQSNLIDSAFKYGVKKLLFLGSSCIYPKFANQPISESELLNGYLEKTNEPYAIAKIAGIKLCESFNRQYSKSHGIDFRSIMPTNIYGPGDNYHPQNSHVIPALIRRIHEAKIKDFGNVKIWGTGNAMREFLFVDDLASASVHVMNLEKAIFYNNIDPMCSHINVGTGEDLTIKDLALKIKEVIGYQGELIFDTTKPDGTPRKLLNIQKLSNLGWEYKTSLKEGLKITYEDYKLNTEKSKV